MDIRIKFLEGKLKYLQGQLTSQLFINKAKALVNYNLTNEINHIEDRIRHYLVHLHTKCESMDDFIAYCKEVDNEFEDAGQEHLFCTEFDIPYTGKLDKSVLIHFKTGMATRIRDINSLHKELKNFKSSLESLLQEQKIVKMNNKFEKMGNDFKD